MVNWCCILLLAASMVSPVTGNAAVDSVFLDELTSTELEAGVHGGHTTVIIPVGGTEQSGPHITLGKHNVRVQLLAGRIARALGNAYVAPVLAYVPEGRIDPPTEHMRFAGTISIPEPVFEAVIASAARSLRQHGFRDVVLLGDHGGYQDGLRRVASSLNREWAKTPVRTHFIDAYYRATQTRYVASLKAAGLSEAQIGMHAGSADTSLQLALAPDTVRTGLLAQAAERGRSAGTHGDPRPSSAALGLPGVEAVVQDSVAAIRTAVSSPR